MDAIPFAAIAPLLVLALGFVAYCLFDLRRNREVQVLPRWAWSLVIVLSVPLGGIGYLLWGRRP